MKTIKELIQILKTNWSIPHFSSNEKEPTFKLACYFELPQINFQNELFKNVPSDIIEFWSITKSAELFKDVKYGQWGLKLFSPEDAKFQTKLALQYSPENYFNTDLVIGKFIGDSELLIVSCDNTSKAFGNIIISLPFDKRVDWYFVSNNFTLFLNEYVSSEGDKFWENVKKYEN